MDVDSEKLQPYISLDRVEEIGLERELVECYLCHGLLWRPVGCKNCEKTFCSSCIQEFHKTQSKQICPHGCSTYTERSNPPTIVRLLGGLKINCQYKLNGCNEILLYKELENHEEKCDYQLFSCDGCKQGIIKKFFDQHKIECRMILITCDECLMSFKRETKDLHTTTECLRKQVQQLQIKLINQEKKIELMEDKLKQNDDRWAEFSLIANEVKNQFDQQFQEIQNLDRNL